jgi:hypothetical protein
MCALVVLNATGCSWPPASRSTRSTSTRKGDPGLTSGRRQVRVSLLPILKRLLLSSETKERILVVDLTLALNRLI